MINAALRLQAVSTRDRRTIAVGMACIFGMILVAKILPAERKWDDREEMRAMLSERELAEARSLISEEGSTREALAARSRELRKLEVGLVRSETISGGETALAAVISTAAAAAGIKVGALALDTDTGDHGTLRTVSVTAEASGDIQGLASFLGALEGTRSRLAVRALSITPSDPVAPETRAETLRLELTVQAQVITAARMIP